MFAFLIKTLAAPLIGSVITAAAGLITGWLNSQRDRQLGAAQATIAVQAQTVQTEQAVAQAEASAPKTQGQDVDAFNADQV